MVSNLKCRGLGKMDRIRRDAMVEAILASGGVWNVAARTLGIARTTFLKNAEKYGISRTEIATEVREEIEELVGEFRARRDLEAQTLDRANRAMRLALLPKGDIKAIGAAA